jgi:hypothetical protein
LARKPLAALQGWLIKSVQPLAGAWPWRGSTEACSEVLQVRLPAAATVRCSPGERNSAHRDHDRHRSAKSSLTAVALDETGHLLATRRIAVNAAAYKTLTSWAARWPHRRFAVEGATGLGRGIAQLLAAAGEHVVDVPATLAARARLLDTGGTRKTEAADAASVAHAAILWGSQSRFGYAACEYSLINSPKIGHRRTRAAVRSTTSDGRFGGR